ncbi:MAG: YsnF/AvaK domain-containing protein [Candidatus Eremiobacteraeota bacterium]|nr:YsnF/AvaK domain-containing protein [Candidatus Eremiobacteraeota bacterium]
MYDDEGNTTTVYFERESDAQAAAQSLESEGYDARVHTRGTAGESFLDGLKRMFSNTTTPADGGALLEVSGDRSTIAPIVQRYGGQFQTYGSGDTTSSTDTDETQRLRLREERMEVTKQRVQEGEVRVGKEVVTQHQETDVPVGHDEVYVERRPVAEGTYETDDALGEEREIRIPVMREEVDVQKRPVVTEEVEVGKRRVEETTRVGADLKKERAVVDGDEEFIRDDNL